jgi:hypothetical protein
MLRSRMQRGAAGVGKKARVTHGGDSYARTMTEKVVSSRCGQLLCAQSIMRKR